MSASLGQGPASSVAPAIDVRGLTKRYAGRPVVDDLTFAVGRGEIFALLGPNGAGKTTTIEILEGYRPRDAGDVAVLGFDPARDAPALRRQMGLMLQEGGIYPQARPAEMLRLVASFYPNPDDPERLLRLVDLEAVRQTSYRRLSGGQRQRLALALALIGRPSLVFLDEPTAGMDAQARRLTWSTIRALKAQGVTVVLTTHDLDEAEALAARVAIMASGRIVAMGTLAELRADRATTVRVTAVHPLPEPALSALAALRHARSVQRVEPAIVAIDSAEPAHLLCEVAAWAVATGIELRELRVGDESLEEIYLRVTAADQRA